MDKKIDADIKPIKKPNQTPIAFNSVYIAKYTITGNPIIPNKSCFPFWGVL